MRRPRQPARLAVLGLLLLCAGCLPYRAQFLRLGVTLIEPPKGPPTAYLLIDELRERMPAIDLTDVAYYFRGRDALPFEYLDSDEDGADDLVRVTLPVDATTATEHWVIVVSPR